MKWKTVERRSDVLKTGNAVSTNCPVCFKEIKLYRYPNLNKCVSCCGHYFVLEPVKVDLVVFTKNTSTIDPS